MNTYISISEQLSNIDWNFSGVKTVDEWNSLHPYPAKFIPQIPRTLIKELSVPEGACILDPFCGSGTSLVEAQSLGIPSFGIDLNPIACLISRVKTQPLPLSFLDSAFECVNKAKLVNDIVIPDIPNLDHWFKKDIQQSLSSLIHQINGVSDNLIRDALRLAFSSIIVRVSNQESDTRYAAIVKNTVKEDVFSLFISSCQRILKAKEKDTERYIISATVLQKDILTVSENDFTQPVGLVITSPPYPNAYEYWLYHKYRMWWLGYDPIDVKEHEIGARAHYFKKNHQTADDFKIQMESILKLLQKVVIRDGFICIVIGRSVIHGQYIDNAAIIEDLAKSVKMDTIAKITRNIPSNKKSFNLSHARIKEETILVLHRK